MSRRERRYSRVPGRTPPVPGSRGQSIPKHNRFRGRGLPCFRNACAAAQVAAAVEKLRGAKPVGSPEHLEAVRGLRRLLSNCEP